jgi:hypothetical protein
LLIDLGGLQKSLAGIFLIATLVISKKLFMTDILGSLYLVKRYTETEEKDEEKTERIDNNLVKSSMTLDGN